MLTAHLAELPQGSCAVGNFAMKSEEWAKRGVKVPRRPDGAVDCCQLSHLAYSHERAIIHGHYDTCHEG